MGNVTIYDIARRTKLSPSTISKALNNYPTIPEATKKKVAKACKDMGYIPNVSAKSLSKRSSRNVGILAYFGLDISPFRMPLFMGILDSFQREMNEKNYDLLFIGKSVAGREGTFYENCISRDVAGVLLLGRLDSRQMEEVIDSPLPSVGFDYGGEKMTRVASDNYAAAKKLTSHLLSLGHKNIVFVHGEDNFPTQERIRGFLDAFEEKGIAPTRDPLVEAQYLDAASVKNLTSNLLRRINPPTAILFPDDTSAVSGLSAISEAGLSCPKDISIAGFDGIETSQLVTPHLTTVKQDLDKIGKALANELILAMEEGGAYFPRKIVIPSTLLLGQSTGKKE